MRRTQEIRTHIVHACVCVRVSVLATIQKAKQISHKFACQQQLAIFRRLKHKPANKPTNKRTNKQANKQANE